MIADRNMMLSILDAETGEAAGSAKEVSATGVSEDGKFVYLRKTKGDVAKIDSTGKELWSMPAHMGYIPTAPTEKDGVVMLQWQGNRLRPRRRQREGALAIPGVATAVRDGLGGK